MKPLQTLALLLLLLCGAVASRYSSPQWQRYQAAPWLARAELALTRGDIARARAAVAQALHHDPASPQGRRLIARLGAAPTLAAAAPDAIPQPREGGLTLSLSLATPAVFEALLLAHQLDPPRRVPPPAPGPAPPGAGAHAPPIARQLVPQQPVALPPALAGLEPAAGPDLLGVGSSGQGGGWLRWLSFAQAHALQGGAPGGAAPAPLRGTAQSGPLLPARTPAPAPAVVLAPDGVSRTPDGAPVPLLSGAIAWVWQGESAPGGSGRPGGAGYLGAEAGLRLAQPGRGVVRATASQFTALAPGDGWPRPETAQASLGLRWQPDRSVPAWVAVERLVPVGDSARSAWMLRAAASHGTGYSAPPDAESWWHMHVYGDVALIGVQARDLYGLAEGRFGRGLRLGTRTQLIGYAHARVLSAEADGWPVSIEAGPGVSVRLTAAPLTFDARFDYRFGLTGTDDGPRLSLATQF